MTYDRNSHNIPEKANRILNVILVALLLISVRVWHLAVIQYDQKLEESKRPQRRVVREAAKRATINDRFGIPLALNKIQYNASILYSQLRQIPTSAWETGPDGVKTKQFKRKNYIAGLSQLLGEELGLDSGRVEDLIHSKAALYAGIPFVLKEDITEAQYYRLKMLEKDWPGIHVQCIPKRHYPRGKVASDILGYMGAIDRDAYEAILSEMQTLEIFLKECDEGVTPELPSGVLTLDKAEERLKELRKLAYSIHDYVGKAGIEGRYENILKGFQGKKVYYADARGTFLREFPDSSQPLPGKRIDLTISAELQEYAEVLLAQNEMIRQTRAATHDSVKKVIRNAKQPWIKGGGILAMDPNTGEVLAMATYPRFDPNDFIAGGDREQMRQKSRQVLRWLENPRQIAEIWNQERPLEKEVYDDDAGMFREEQIWMGWDNYLARIVPADGVVAEGMKRVGTVGNALELQECVEEMLALSGQENLYLLFNALYKEDGHQPHTVKDDVAARKKIEEALSKQADAFAKAKRKAAYYLDSIPRNYDKVLVVDLCRLSIDAGRVAPELRSKLKKQSLSQYRDASAAFLAVSEAVRKMAGELYHDQEFAAWRKENEKEFLKEKRAIEKAEKKYAKPYIDYLDAKEEELFAQFWNDHKWGMILAFVKGMGCGGVPSYTDHLARWHDEMARGAHGEAPWKLSYDRLKESLAPMGDSLSVAYMQSMRSYRDLDRPVLGRYRHLRKEKGVQTEKHLAAAFYPVYGYGYGRSQGYRQSATQGSIFKLVTAHEALLQRYKRLGQKNPAEKSLNPLTLTDQYYKQGKEVFLGYLEDGTPLPRNYKGGRVPKSTRSFGTCNLLRALEVSSNPYFSILAGDVLESPEDLARAARNFCYGSRTGIDLPWEISGKIPNDLSTNRTGLYAMAIGQHSLVVTPLQTCIMLAAIANGGDVLQPRITDYVKGTTVKQQVMMPEVIRQILLKGLHRVVQRTQEESLSSLSRLYHNHPGAISDYIDLKDELVGKTSTSESVENIDLDSVEGTNVYTHVWFGGISFDPDAVAVAKDSFGKPELVVVVYLRYGAFGKEAAPVAAQIVKKWREIKNLSQ